MSIILKIKGPKGSGKTTSAERIRTAISAVASTGSMTTAGREQLLTMREPAMLLTSSRGDQDTWEMLRIPIASLLTHLDQLGLDYEQTGTTITVNAAVAL